MKSPLIGGTAREMCVWRTLLIGQKSGKPVYAGGVEEVGEQVDVAGPELILALHVDVQEVLFPHLPSR